MSFSQITCHRKSDEIKITTKYFANAKDLDSFTCVDYSAYSECLVTGGKNGYLYVWSSKNKWSCEKKLDGHKTSITHIMYNNVDNVFISISADKKVHVWTDFTFQPLQNLYPYCMQQAPISTVCYNIYNNKLFLAITEIAKCFGKGTDFFKESMTSFNMPVCRTLYNCLYNQLVSVSVNGMVTVWDILTGKAVMDFSVNPTHLVGHIAISFDKTQHKLITISQDRKVRVWNFNNGLELDVLPVQIPDDVKDIICSKNRLLVSVKNSNNILDLDFKGKDKRVLSHHLLCDICSMELHEQTLIATSSNGYFVIWNPKTSEVLHYGTTKESPETPIETVEMQKQCAQHLEKKVKENSLGTSTNHKNEQNLRPIVLSLKTRKANRKTASLLISNHGFIFSWSVQENAELIGKFRAVESEDAYITSMSTDRRDKTLLTGDSTGRVCLWDIKNFGLGTEDVNRPRETQNEWNVSLCPPPLLKSWQASLSEIVSVVCDPACEKIFTTGLDLGVKQWKKNGVCVGEFGKDEWQENQEDPKGSVQTSTEPDMKIPGLTLDPERNVPLPPI